MVPVAPRMRRMVRLFPNNLTPCLSNKPPEIVKLITDLKNTTSTAGICDTNFTHKFISEKKKIARTISLTPEEICMAFG